MGTEDLDVLRRRPPAIAAAIVEGTAACLDDRGLDGSLYVTAHEHDSRLLASRYLGDPVYYSGLLPTLTMEAAETSGYRTVLRPHPPESYDPTRLPDAYADALGGDESSDMVELAIPGFGVVAVPAHGCVASSAEEVFGSVLDWLLADQFVIAGIRQFSAAALESPRVREIAGAYSRCMSSAGYRADNPAQAAQTARETWVAAGTEAASPGADEIAMAMADAECQSAHPVLRVAEETTLDLASPWIDSNAEAILAAAAAQRRALEFCSSRRGST